MSQFINKDVSNLCSLLPRAQILTGVFRDILTRYFVSGAYIEDPQLKDMLWKEGQDTGILIESIHRWRPEVTEKRPAIIVKRNAYQNERKGIGDRRQGPPVDSEGFAHYTTFWTGSHTLFCIGGSGAQAELLGSAVQRHLTQFTPVIAEALDLKRMQVLQVGAVAELEEGQENFVVPVTVGYTYEERWVIRPQVPLLSHIVLNLILDF
jgi:hypothetical protein